MFSCQFVASPSSSSAPTLASSFLWSIRKPLPPIFLSCPSSSSSSTFLRFSSSLPQQPLRCAVLGAGFAGLSVAWHLLQHGSRDLPLLVDIYDEVGIGGGASGVAGGLLHPYSPKVKLLWRAEECWNESLKLIRIAERARQSKVLNTERQEAVQSMNFSIIRRRLVLSLVSYEILGCVSSAVLSHTGLLLKIHTHQSKDKATVGIGISATDSMGSVPWTRVFGSSREYNAVVICLGARAAFLPEFSGILPLRTCRGVVTHMQLSDNIREEYPQHSPSILSDAWLAVEGPRDLYLGSTWEWRSTNYSRTVPTVEASEALQELLSKGSVIYPAISNWTVRGAVAGLRAMPPLTPHGSSQDLITQKRWNRVVVL
ncbi:uncharacterized protein LOC113774411 [Coffea eugenioides]|uniref:uncharacterized protein LOC113774411 n=1 Tax=Coffea eugenioides TaxID=49369 RepID=UPI000F60C00F|nr:uncharacterized protein LOC113774411 [Coffea eugenioides]